ncbi:MAG: DUF493 family protein [Ichthyobacteriaceae bacterium]|nr:DUF493 family protein [Ichthyobacteriaceae bacterium]
MQQDRDAFYSNLKIQLEDTTKKWPTEYLYKFILPAIGNNTKIIEDIFNNTGAKISTRVSKTGKYTSYSIKIIMKSADDIIKKYRECEVIEGIVSL